MYLVKRETIEWWQSPDLKPQTTSLVNKLNSNVSNTGCMVFLCDFHREQAWERSTTKSANGVSYKKEEVLAKLWLIANSETEEIYQERGHTFRESSVWKENNHVREWFENHWLKEHKVSGNWEICPLPTTHRHKHSHPNCVFLPFFP